MVVPFDSLPGRSKALSSRPPLPHRQSRWTLQLAKEENQHPEVIPRYTEGNMRSPHLQLAKEQTSTHILSSPVPTSVNISLQSAVSAMSTKHIPPASSGSLITNRLWSMTAT